MKRNEKNRRQDYIPHTYCAMVLILLLASVLLAMKVSPTDYAGFASTNKPYTEKYVIEDRGEQADFPYSHDREAGQKAVIKAKIPEDIEGNRIICFRADQLDVKVYVDGELRLDYVASQNRKYGKVSPRRYLFMPTKQNDAGKDMEIELCTAVNHAGTLDAVAYGDRYDVTVALLQGNISDIVIAFIMLIICVLCLVCGIVLSFGLKTFFEITYLAMMGVLASIWILCNAEVSQFYFRNMSTAMTVLYIMLMMMPFPFLFFMNKVQKQKYDIVYRIFEYLAVLESLVCLSLLAMGILDLSQVFIPIAVVFACSLLMILITICIDIFCFKNYSYAIVSLGILAGIVATIIQMALYLLDVYSFGGKAIAIALLIVLFTSIIDTFCRIRNMEVEKQMAIAHSQAESHFLANMSHEIRTPINAVLGLNEMIIRETQEDQTLGYARQIDSSGKLLLSIVNDILDLSKIRSGKMKIIEDKYSLNEVIQDVIGMVQNKAEKKGLEFVVTVDETIPNNLIGDETRVKQIMINILNNAVKYTDRGNVALAVSASSNKEDEMTLRFSVTDTGRGIKTEDRETLFEAFARVDEKNNKSIEGTGLGLALVKKLVDSMNGNITVDSTYGKGSVFTVEIPQKRIDNVTIAEAKNFAQREDKAASKENGKMEKRNVALFTAPSANVLVVDDVKVNLAVVKNLLKRTKVNVTTASSGADCITILKEQSFDVVLLDHLMPEMDGVETLAIIKKEKLAGSASVIALTANAIAGAREQYLGFGFNDYLTKPVIGEDLEKMLLKYIPESKVEITVE